MTTIIITAIATALFIGILRLAYCDAKRRAKALSRKARRRVGSQSRRVRVPQRTQLEAIDGGRSPWAGPVPRQRRAA